MAKSTKAEKAAQAAVAAAAAAAKDAKRLGKEIGDDLPKKHVKRLRARADEAKDAAKVSKKKLSRHPRRVEKAASEATARLDKTSAKVTAKHAAALSARQETAGDATAPSPDQLSSLTVVELRARARAEGRSGYSRLRKAQLVDLLSP